MPFIRALGMGLLASCALLAGCEPAKPLVSLTAAPPPADAETLKKQADFTKTEAFYYDITQQNFQEITCNIDVSIADNLVQQMRTYLERMSDDKATLSDTLASYRLTYKKAGGLHIDDPTLDLTMKPGTKPVDPAKVELGKNKLQEGFKALIAGSDASIGLIMHFEEPSTPSDYDIIYVNLTPDGYEMSFKSKKSGIQETSSLAGTTYDGKYFSPDGSQSTRIAHSRKLEDGKLLLTDVSDAGSGVMGKSSAVTAVTYQTIGAIYFPAKVEIQASVDSIQTHQSVTTDFTFSDCAIK